MDVHTVNVGAACGWVVDNPHPQTPPFLWISTGGRLSGRGYPFGTDVQTLGKVEMAKLAPDEPHALYRFFGAGGTLLYIGITNEIPRRLKQHSGDKPWWLGVSSITVEHYPSREAVLEAERRAIITEKPLYNDQHNRAGRWPKVETTVETVVKTVEVHTDVLVPVCMECDNAIDDWCDGLLHIPHREVNRAQREWREWNEKPQGGYIEGLMAMPDVVPWQVHCRACNPHVDASDGGLCPGCYAISINECRSWRALLRWTSHLADKSWLGVTDWFDLIGAVARGDEDAPFITEAVSRAAV